MVASAVAPCLVASVVPVASASPGLPASAMAPDQAEVDAVIAQAVEKFQNKEYDEAAVLFEQAYDMSPEPNYLFNIGRVYEEKGDLEKAVEYYGRFVREGEVELGAREVALERLQVLRAVLKETGVEVDEGLDEEGTEDEEDPDVVDDPTQPPDQPPVDDGKDEKKPNALRISGAVLIGVGVATLGTGGAFAGLAVRDNNDLEELDMLEPREEKRDDGKRNALVADIMFGVGAAITVTGVVLLAISFKKKPNASARARVSPMLGRRGGGIAAEVRF